MPRTLIFLCGLLATLQTNAAPNLLLIIADDCTYRDMEVYGGQAKTPHLNKLASEGMKFTRCFQAAPMCSPTRHCLYTGLYPVKSGAYPNHTMAYDWVKSIATYLNEAGYTSHLSGKTHINPKSVFPFEYSSLKGDNNPDPAVFAEVLKSSAQNGKPFLFIAASNEPHTPWNKGDPSAYPPSSLKLPPVLVDSPDTREGFSKYLAEITYFDSQVGELVGLLDQSPLRDNTLVIVLSEQGNSLPFAKWTCYDAGLASACIARWPSQVKAGTVSDALVEYVDVTPTFLDAAGVAQPDGTTRLRHPDDLVGRQRLDRADRHGVEMSCPRGPADVIDVVPECRCRANARIKFGELTAEALQQQVAGLDLAHHVDRIGTFPCRDLGKSIIRRGPPFPIQLG